MLVVISKTIHFFQIKLILMIIFQVSKLTESTMNTFLEYIQRNLPEGVAMKVTKHERKQLPDHILKTILSEPPLEEQ